MIESSGAMGLHLQADGPEGRAAIEGELTIRNVSALRDEIGARCSDCLALEVDLSGVTQIDPAGLQWLAWPGGGLMVRFINHSAAVVRMLESVQTCHARRLRNSGPL